MKKLKPGVYIRDWGEEGLEIGILEEVNYSSLTPYRASIETDDFIYMLNLDKWIYIGEL